MQVCRTLSCLTAGLLTSALSIGCLAPLRDDQWLSAPGSSPVWQLQSGHLRSAAGCRFSYRVLEPRAPESDVTVLIGHGFLRNQNTMGDLARTLAGAGYRTATLDFCNMRPWNGHHRRNAADLLQLAEHLQAREIILAGFSAGALAALLAGTEYARSDEPRARQHRLSVLGRVLLDPVDQDAIGAAALAGIHSPVVALQGPADKCNAGAEAGTLYARHTNVSLLPITAASHCEFESPSNWLCECLCGDSGSKQANEQTRTTIITLVVEQVRQLARSGRAPAP